MLAYKPLLQITMQISLLCKYVNKRREKKRENAKAYSIDKPLLPTTFYREAARNCYLQKGLICQLLILFFIN